MKSLILAIISVLAVPSLALAATVQVYPTITNSSGGTHFAKDITVCITSAGVQQCDTGVPTFHIPAGPYEVQFFPPPGYKESHDELTCSGIATDNDAIKCDVHYQDGVKITLPPPPQEPAPIQAPAPPAPAPTPVAPAPIPQETPTTPAIEPVPIVNPVVTATQETAAPTAPVVQTIIKEVTIIREVPVESTSTQAQIAQIQRQVSILEATVNWIKSVIGSFFSIFHR